MVRRHAIHRSWRLTACLHNGLCLLAELCAVTHLAAKEIACDDAVHVGVAWQTDEDTISTRVMSTLERNSMLTC